MDKINQGQHAHTGTGRHAGVRDVCAGVSEPSKGFMGTMLSTSMSSTSLPRSSTGGGCVCACVHMSVHDRVVDVTVFLVLAKEQLLKPQLLQFQTVTPGADTHAAPTPRAPPEARLTSWCWKVASRNI